MKFQTFAKLTALGILSALSIGCGADAKSQVNLDAVDSLSDTQTAEVLTVRDGGNAADYPEWTPEQELSLDTLGAGYFSTK